MHLQTEKWICSVILFIGAVTSEKILMIPAQQVSHVWEQMAVAEELIARGHTVHMLLQNTFSKLDTVLERGIHPVTYSPGEGDVSKPLARMEATCFNKDFQPRAHAPWLIASFKMECTELLHNEELMHGLEQENYDISVVDGFIFSRCLFLIPRHLSIPYACMTSSSLDLALGLPNPPSISVTAVTEYPPTMTFWQRLKNTFGQIAFSYFLVPKTDTPDLVAKFAPGESSLDSIIRKSSLILYSRDHVLEWPYITLPNFIRTPAVTIREGRPLTWEFQDMMEASPSGVIVFSFGSTVENIPLDLLEKLIVGLGNVPQTVIVRVSKSIMTNAMVARPENVKFVTWMPQQDILAHPNTQLFITHCGHNGQSESVYHGVPIIGFPLFGDQPHNCMRIREKGLGICMSIHDFTPEELSRNIVTLIKNQTILQTVKKYQALLRNLPAPTKAAAEGLEHVMRFGSEHLRSPAFDLRPYQVFMLDIFVFVIVIFVLFIYIVKILLLWIYAKMRNKRVQLYDREKFD